MNTHTLQSMTHSEQWAGIMLWHPESKMGLSTLLKGNIPQ